MAHYRYLVLFLVLITPNTQAQETTQAAIQAGVEYFRWQEFDAGSRLLEETGRRFSIGAAWDNFQRTSPGTLYGANGRIYIGSVNYDGQTQSGTPVETDTNYFGLNIEGQGGYRFGSRIAFDLLGTIGLDTWQRSLEDSTTASGQPVSGYDETYTILYAKLGPGMFHDLGAWRYRFHLGIKYPLYTDEYVNLEDGVYLSPEPRLSYFGLIQADFNRSGRLRFGVAVFYDSYRFAESDPELLTQRSIVIATVVQPESHMDVFGVQVRFFIF